MADWAAVLQDHLVLSSQPPAMQATYCPLIFPQAPASVLPNLPHYLQRAWPLALAALTLAPALAQEVRFSCLDSPIFPFCSHIPSYHTNVILL